MEHYYEIVYHAPYEDDLISTHETLEEAIEFANIHSLPIIHEIGGNWADYEKCWFCEERHLKCLKNTRFEAN